MSYHQHYTLSGAPLSTALNTSDRFICRYRRATTVTPTRRPRANPLSTPDGVARLRARRLTLRPRTRNANGQVYSLPMSIPPLPLTLLTHFVGGRHILREEPRRTQKCSTMPRKGEGVFADSFVDADVYWLLMFVVSVQWLN